MLTLLIKKVQREKSATRKKWNSRGVARTSSTPLINGIVNYCCKALIVNVWGGPSYNPGNSAT